MIRLLIVVLLLSAASCSKQAKEEKTKAEAAAAAKPAVISVKTATAEARTVAKTILVTGSLTPDDTVTLTAEVPGRVKSVKVDFGSRVRKGDVVVELDSREYEWQVERSKSALAQALARVGAASPDAPPTSTPAMRQIEAQIADAKFKSESAAKLVNTGDISQERFTELEKAYQARVASLEGARDELRTQWAALQALQADVKLTEKRLSDTLIRAPFDGIVSARLASPGQYVKDNNNLVTIVKTDPLRLHLDVPEAGSTFVKPGATIEFTSDATPGSVFRAVVRELNPSLESRSRSLSAEARLIGRDPRLKPGMFVQVKLVVAADAKIVAVPKQAVYTIAGLTKLFRLDGNRAKEIRFVPGIEDGGWIEVPGDLIKPGDRLAASALNQLVNGSEVSQ